MKTILFNIMVTGLLLFSSLSLAKEIVHDAEYYILEAQNGEKWKAEDKKG